MNERIYYDLTCEQKEILDNDFILHHANLGKRRADIELISNGTSEYSADRAKLMVR